MPILENGGQPGQQVFDWRCHLRHSNDIDNALQRAQNATKYLWVFLTQVLVEDHPQVTQQLLLIALLQHITLMNRGTPKMHTACYFDLVTLIWHRGAFNGVRCARCPISFKVRKQECVSHLHHDGNARNQIRSLLANL